MPQPLPIPEEASFTFADYFKLNVDAEVIVEYFGYSLSIEDCTLPHHKLDTDQLAAAKVRVKESLSFVSLSSEVARREFLIAPILLEAVHHSHAKVKVEYPLAVSDKLQGTLDYLLEGKNNVLVVEAKNADLQRGFTQLAVELIAFDKWLGEPSPEIVWGAVSMGDGWRFAYLDRPSSRIIKDLNLYSLPGDLEELLEILVAILTE